LTTEEKVTKAESEIGTAFAFLNSYKYYCNETSEMRDAENEDNEEI